MIANRSFLEVMKIWYEEHPNCAAAKKILSHLNAQLGDMQEIKRSVGVVPDSLDANLPESLQTQTMEAPDRLMTEKLALKERVNDSEDKIDREVLIAKQELAYMGNISIPFLIRKIGCTHERACEIYAQVMGNGTAT